MSYKTVFPELLALMFIYLKLTEQIDWSWWWVLSPVWISLAILAVLVLTAFFWAWIEMRD